VVRGLEKDKRELDRKVTKVERELEQERKESDRKLENLRKKISGLESNMKEQQNNQNATVQIRRSSSNSPGHGRNSQVTRSPGGTSILNENYSVSEAVHLALKKEYEILVLKNQSQERNYLSIQESLKKEIDDLNSQLLARDVEVETLTERVEELLKKIKELQNYSLEQQFKINVSNSGMGTIVSASSPKMLSPKNLSLVGGGVSNTIGPSGNFGSNTIGPSGVGPISGGFNYSANTLSHSGTTFSPTTENRIELEIKKRTSQHIEREMKLNTELDDLRGECNGLKKNLDDALGKMGVLNFGNDGGIGGVNMDNYGLSATSGHGSPTLSQ